jgi:hypothetical protein
VGLFFSLASFWVFETIFVKLLEIRSFFSPHIILGVGKQQDFEKRILPYSSRKLLFAMFLIS